MKILKIFILLLFGIILSYFIAKSIRNIGVVDKPAQYRTDHFLINYHGIYKKEAEVIGNILEENYDRVRDELHDPAHNTIRVYIYSTQQDFNEGTGLTNGSANGTSRGPLEFHVLWTNWYNSIFPDDPRKTAVHEFTHCFQLNILIKEAFKKWDWEDDAEFNRAFEKKFSDEYPQWFWEALCIYLAGEVNSIMRYAMKDPLTLDDLNHSNQIYNVGYTLIEYIVDTWGKDKIPDLITSYVDLEEVLKVSEADFEEGWRYFVKEEY
jgi:hypothetical protein